MELQATEEVILAGTQLEAAWEVLDREDSAWAVEVDAGMSFFILYCTSLVNLKITDDIKLSIAIQDHEKVDTKTQQTIFRLYREEMPRELPTRRVIAYHDLDAPGNDPFD